MILDRQLPELAAYRRLERELPLQPDNFFEKLVVQKVGDDAKVHRWFRFKEAFSPDLLTASLKLLLPSLGKNFTLLDPFCGVGTSLIASQELRICGFDIRAIGIERNPFIAFAARTKANWHEIDVSQIEQLGARALLDASKHKPLIPPLSSITKGRCLTRYMANRLLAVRAAIQQNGCGASYDALLLGLASAIEPLSRIRKDGRALRIVGGRHERLSDQLSLKWQMIRSDAAFFQANIEAKSIPNVILGDGRTPSKVGIKPHSVDLIFTSPPYPNNIDYTEVYKLELWLLGFIRNQTEFLELRRSTFRSHPTIICKETPLGFERILSEEPLRSSLSSLMCRVGKSKEKWRKRLLTAYFVDIWTSLREYYNCLTEKGCVVLALGNSLHGGPDFPYLIATDLLVAAIAESTGFKVERIVIARNLRRRLSGNHFLRESVLFLKKK